MDHTVITKIITQLEDQQTKCSKLEGIRIESIIARLKRLNTGKLNHNDDRTIEEKIRIARTNLKKYIRKQWNDCEDLRDKCEDEGVACFYYSYTVVPGVDFDTFENFIRSNECFCGKCDKN